MMSADMVRFMLPDIPSLKNEIQQVISRYVREESHRKLGALALSPIHLIHEGDRMKTIRADGSIDISTLKRASSYVSIPYEEIGKLTTEHRIRLLDELSDDMARQMAIHLYGSLDDALRDAGQVIDASNMTLIESLFAAFEKINLDFDDDGEIKGYAISAGSAAFERLKSAEHQLHADPVLLKRWKDLIDRKREEWRAREASRKLVG
jgi:hypothetical protein